MNDKDRVRQRYENIEKGITGSSSSTNRLSRYDQELQELAASLAAFDARSRSKVETGLKQTLLAQMNDRQSGGQSMNKPHHLRRLSLAVLAAAGILAIVILSVPSLRAAAETLFTRIGNMIINNNPTDAEKYVATMQSGTPTPTLDPNWKCTDCPEPQIAGLLTVKQASEQAGYLVLEADYIPSGYDLSSRDVLKTGQTITTSTDYRMELEQPLHDGLQMAGIIAIGQTQFLTDSQTWESSVGDVPIVEVTVRGNPGAWLEQVPVYPFQDAEGNWQYTYWNQLVWSENGFNFIIQTNMPVDLLPLDELMKIADSMQ